MELVELVGDKNKKRKQETHVQGSTDQRAVRCAAPLWGRISQSTLEFKCWVKRKNGLQESNGTTSMAGASHGTGRRKGRVLEDIEKFAVGLGKIILFSGRVG